MIRFLCIKRGSDIKNNISNIFIELMCLPNRIYYSLISMNILISISCDRLVTSMSKHVTTNIFPILKFLSPPIHCPRQSDQDVDKGKGTETRRSKKPCLCSPR